MLEASRRRLLDRLDSSAVVLDIGGWADPLARADWVIDLMPHDTRGLYERRGWIPPRGERDSERFTRETWVQRDLCDRDPYPFADRSIDFVVCSQTLEDIRDPLWVCAEMNRIARAGYIEIPSRLEEQSWGVDGPFAGWPHHHWLIDVVDDHVEFVFKTHEIHFRPDLHFPAGFWPTLTEEERVQTLWWDGGFTYRERVFVEEKPTETYLPDFVARELARRAPPPEDRSGPLRWLSRRPPQAGS